MDNILDIDAFIETVDGLTPFRLTVSAAMQSIEGDHKCVVSLTPMFSNKKEIFGVTKAQAEELARQFVRDILKDVRIVNKDHLEISI